MDVSVIIPLFNRLDLTRACLESFERTTRGLRCEVLLIDDGSTDGTREFLRGIEGPERRVIFNEQPRGYAANNNLAARLSRAPTLCLLNNDTSLLPGWLDGMLRVLRLAPSPGLVGNVQREPLSGLIDHIGITFNAEGFPVHAGKDLPAPPLETYARWPAVTGACCVVRREVYRRYGGLDESFINGFEDVDFCLRTAEKGLAHYTANRSVIYHHISSSPGRHANEERNRALYRQRWGLRAMTYLRRREEDRMAALREAALPEIGEEDARKAYEDAREARRQHRQDIIDAREDGRRYLGKHLLRPWRYNYRRVCEALVRATRPAPAPMIPLSTQLTFCAGQSTANGSDVEDFLFDPPH